MKVNCAAVYCDVPKIELQDKTAILVDTLRASASIITAVANGCDRIVPTSEANEAAAIKRISEGNLLLCGENGAEKVSGFDMGNSPFEYTRDAIENEILIFSTTNGTMAIKALANAENILVASFLNAAATAKLALSFGLDIIMVGAGMEKKFSTGDILSMGCIIDRILRFDHQIMLDDLGRIALKLYYSANRNYLKALEGSLEYEYLIQCGYENDVRYSVQEDIFDVVPVYREGVIIKG